MKSSLHNHSVFCDGKNTPREMVESAIKKDFTDFGFSGHSPNKEFFGGWGMEKELEYIKEVKSLKQEYKDKINIYLGLEQDYYGPTTYRNDYEYIIGSVHGFTNNEKIKYYAVDNGVNEIIEGTDKVFGGDIYKTIYEYYNLVVENSFLYKPDIIGHFDLIVKHNEGNILFKESSLEYKNISLTALDKLIDNQNIIEINTGAISRGFRKEPYPSSELLYRIYKRNGNIILSGDSHSTDTVDYWFKEANELLKDIGFKKVVTYVDGKFQKLQIP